MRSFKNIIIVILAFFISVNYVYAVELNCNNTLKRGSKGNNVKMLQERLNDVMGCDLEVDGVFGKKTYACVVKFEDKYGLKKDGIVGKDTCSKLNAEIDGYDKNYDGTYNFDFSDGKYVIVIKNDSKIYDSKMEGASIVDSVKFGKLYKYVSYNEKWYKIIDDNGNYRYIKSDNVRKSFIMVDISEQRLIYLKNNKLVVDTNVVTGMKNKHDTPVGYYMIRKSNKDRNRTLRGTNDNGTKYAAYVSYWMPFITDRGIGFHDASWRDLDDFNDSTYIYDGSHGCVNMSSDAASTLYKAITYDEDVIIRD